MEKISTINTERFLTGLSHTDLEELFKIYKQSPEAQGQKNINNITTLAKYFISSQTYALLSYYKKVNALGADGFFEALFADIYPSIYEVLAPLSTDPLINDAYERLRPSRISKGKLDFWEYLLPDTDTTVASDDARIVLESFMNDKKDVYEAVRINKYTLPGASTTLKGKIQHIGKYWSEYDKQYRTIKGLYELLEHSLLTLLLAKKIPSLHRTLALVESPLFLQLTIDDIDVYLDIPSKMMVDYLLVHTDLDLDTIGYTERIFKGTNARIAFYLIERGEKEGLSFDISPHLANLLKIAVQIRHTGLMRKVINWVGPRGEVIAFTDDLVTTYKLIALLITMDDLVTLESILSWENPQTEEVGLPVNQKNMLHLGDAIIEAMAKNQGKNAIPIATLFLEWVGVNGERFHPESYSKDPVAAAASLGNAEMVRFLMRSPDVLFYSELSKTLKHAIESGDTETVRILLEWDELTLEDFELSGWHALDYLGEYGNPDMIQLISDWRGPEEEYVDLSKSGAARSAIMVNKPKNLKKLLQWRGPEEEYIDLFELNAVMEAAYGNPEVLEILIDWRDLEEDALDITDDGDEILLEAINEGERGLVRALLRWRGLEDEFIDPRLQTEEIKDALSNSRDPVILKMLLDWVSPAGEKIDMSSADLVEKLHKAKKLYDENSPITEWSKQNEKDVDEMLRLLNTQRNRANYRATKAPSSPSKDHGVGTVRRGLDGKQWKVTKTKKGHRWVRE